MKRKKSKSSILTFQKSDQNGALMKHIFENLEDVPDKESSTEKNIHQNSIKKSRSSVRNSIKRPDDEIDLHGKTREEAIKLVQNFVIDCYQKNLSSALIITGKGHHSSEKFPILKREVRLWLEREGDAYIADFHEAPPRFGGSGAIWLNFK